MQQFSTDYVWPGERVEYWREAICRTYVALDCTSLQERAFRGALAVSALGDLSISRVAASAQRVERTRRLIADAQADWFLLSLQCKGHGRVVQDGRVAELQPGDMALYDSIRPYELHFEAWFGQMVVRLPRRLLLDALPCAEGMIARRIAGDQGVGAALVDFLHSLYRHVDEISAELRPRLGETAADLLAASLQEQFGEGGAGARRRTHRLRQLGRVRSYIRAHLDQAHLKPEAIATAMGLSLRQLHLLFVGEEESLSRYIWRQRLERCREDLGDPCKAGLSIGEIAFGWGFSDLPHFSRSFKTCFGRTPSAYRRERLLRRA